MPTPWQNNILGLWTLWWIAASMNTTFSSDAGSCEYKTSATLLFEYHLLGWTLQACKPCTCPASRPKKELVSATETSLASWMGALTCLKQGPGVTLHHMWCTGVRKYMVAGFILGGMGGLGTRGWGSGGWGDFASYTGVHFPDLLNRDSSRGACP